MLPRAILWSGYRILPNHHPRYTCFLYSHFHLCLGTPPSLYLGMSFFSARRLSFCNVSKFLPRFISFRWLLIALPLRRFAAKDHSLVLNWCHVYSHVSGINVEARNNAQIFPVPRYHGRRTWRGVRIECHWGPLLCEKKSYWVVSTASKKYFCCTLIIIVVIEWVMGKPSPFQQDRDDPQLE